MSQGRHSDAPASTTRSLAAALARVFATSLLEETASTDEEATRGALEAALGRPLTPGQGRLLAAREIERTDVRALALRLPVDAPAEQNRTARAKRQTSPKAALSCADLRLLPPPMWQEAVEWLLGEEKYRLERRGLTRSTKGAGDDGETDDSAHMSREAEHMVWRGQRGEASFHVVATRLPDGWLLDERAIEGCLATARRGQGGDDRLPIVICAPTRASVGATLLARNHGITLYTESALDALLVRVAGAYAEEEARVSESLEERASAAASAREKLLKQIADLLTATERAAQGKGRRKTATSRAAVAEAVAAATPALRTLAQIGLAWDTLIDEWNGAFGATAERAGTLPITQEAPWFAAVVERAGHLRTVALPAVQALAATPPTGELGYGPWRDALCETLTAHWQALRAQATAIDPASWRDFLAARDATRETEASRASREYGHAAARLEKARTELATRAALDVPDL